MELINRGGVENVGPDLQNGSSSQAVERDVSSLPPPKARNRTSRFKINRGGAPQPTERTPEDGPSLNVEPPTPVASSVTERRGSLRLELTQEARSLSPSPIPDTPLTVDERSSPKMPSGDITFATESLPLTPVSRKSAYFSQPTTPTVRKLASVSEILREKTPTPSKTQLPVVIDSPSFTPLPPMLIDSLSFPPPNGCNAVFPSVIVDSPSFAPPQGMTTMPPMIVDSPDFPPPKGATFMPPMIIESPDFPPPKGVFPTPPGTSLNAPAPLVIDSTPLPARPKNPGPPRVMSSRVVERSPAGVNQQRMDAPANKVSRFAAERM